MKPLLSATRSFINEFQPTAAKCAPPTLASFSFIIPIFIQCALLHPSIWANQWARILRVGLVGPCVFWSMRFTLYNCWKPLELNPGKNLGIAIMGCYAAMKSVEWGWSSKPYRLRRMKTVDGTRKWTRESNEKAEMSVEQNGIKNIVLWSIMHMVSFRGLDFNWGLETLANSLTPRDLLIQILKQLVIVYPSFALLQASRIAPNRAPTNVLVSLGIPDFPGSQAGAALLLNICFGCVIFGVIHMFGSCMTLLAYALHRIFHLARLPEALVDYFNPELYPPASMPLFASRSLAYLWANAWHQYVRRSFVTCGSKPMVWIARRMHLSPDGQKAMGLCGAFVISGLYHEYLLMMISRTPHPKPYIIGKTIPGALLFFILQPFGIMIEPWILPLLPEALGGGGWWVALFLVTTVGPYRKLAEPLLSVMPPVYPCLNAD